MNEAHEIISMQFVTEREMMRLVEIYVKDRKGVNITVNPIRNEVDCYLLNKAYDRAIKWYTT